MSNLKITGILPALVTPLDADNKTVNTALAKKLIDFQIGQGADGFYVLGGTGERLCVRPQSRMSVAESPSSCTLPR